MLRSRRRSEVGVEFELWGSANTTPIPPTIEYPIPSDVHHGLVGRLGKKRGGRIRLSGEGLGRDDQALGCSGGLLNGSHVIDFDAEARSTRGYDQLRVHPTKFGGHLGSFTHARLLGGRNRTRPFITFKQRGLRALSELSAEGKMG